MNFEGKVILITGASSGIGAATAEYFSKFGVHLALVGRNLANLEAVSLKCKSSCNKTKVCIIQADVTKDTKKIIEQTIVTFGKLNILINNAGIYRTDSIFDATVEQFDEIMNTNLRSVFVLTKLAIPHLIASQGNIVNVSSLAGLRSYSGVVSYCVSKAALDQFTKCTALELAPHKVRVNSVNPGIIVTNIWQGTGMTKDDYEKYLEKAKSNYPLGRVGEANEVASAIAFLASDEASFITGECLPIDGGKHALCPR